MIHEIAPDPTDPLAIREALDQRNPDGSKPHVRVEGARFHVLSWSTLGRSCTEPDCIVNRPEAEEEG